MEKLRLDIGDELFDQLSTNQKKLIIETSGSINLGKDTDVERMFKNIVDYRENGGLTPPKQKVEKKGANHADQ